jgi:hypothetical protein
VREVWKSVEKQARESLECCKQSLSKKKLSKCSVHQKASRNADNKDCTHELSYGNKDCTGIGLETMHVIFWQRTCLCFVHAPRLHRRLNLNMTY